ncbi:MAG TPA: VIT family protein [Miltoncostaeaceae bacterium]|nr:VIT family protein [Miltoncostaeaceae bacterium]
MRVLPRPRHVERHRSGRTGWLRAAVLGANDGIVSIAGLVLGVAAAGAGRSDLLLAGVAGAVAGALSMAAGEYVSVSSQADAEAADLELERRELERNPDGELDELAAIHAARGLSPDLARRVAEELSRGDRLAAHARDELGFDEGHRARPWQAAWASAAAFSAGAALPVLATLAPDGARRPLIVGVTVVALALLGTVGAMLGGAPARRAALRVVAWGVAAMALTSAVGAAVGAAV